MKKLFVSALLGLAVLPALAQARTFGIFTCGLACKKSCMTVCCRQYNAFTPVCEGSICCQGMMPFGGMPCFPPMPPLVPPCPPPCCDASSPGGDCSPVSTPGQSAQVASQGANPQTTTQQVGYYPYSPAAATSATVAQYPAQAYGQMGYDPMAAYYYWYWYQMAAMQGR